MNDENLVSLATRTKRERIEIAKKGAAASTAKKRANKSYLEIAEIILNGKIGNKPTATVKNLLPEYDDTVTGKVAMLAGQLSAAAKGDAKAYKNIAPLIEQLEGASGDSNNFYIPARLLSSAFVDVNRSIDNRDYLEYVLKGGRGSAKSSFYGLKIPELIINNPDIHGLICRKVANTLRDSVFAQIWWGICELGLEKKFKKTTSPLEITYLKTGQKIFFRGADEPEKIKSIKTDFGYIGILWFEEFDQFNGDEEIRQIQQSAIRGGDMAWIFKSFNPPITNLNWANKYCLIPKNNRLVHHSTYLTTPKEWLGQPFLDEAELLERINPRAYKHEYLGEIVGTGGQVFENLTIRKIEDKEKTAFDWCYFGQDWGYFPDPNAFVGCYYDSARMKLYIYEEHVANKMRNEDWAKVIESHLADKIVADSAENKSIEDFRAYGFNMRAAEKGSGSVDYSMKWLQSRAEIIIDPELCPNAAREFSEYEYDRTKSGEVISSYPDKNNHCIDAVRYATEEIWRKRGQ